MVAQSRQKNYVDKRRRDLSFKIGDFVYLKVSPMRGTRRFKVRGMLAQGMSVHSRSLAASEKLNINSSYCHSC
jgi:hypothetical protein